MLSGMCWIVIRPAERMGRCMSKPVCMNCPWPAGSLYPDRNVIEFRCAVHLRDTGRGYPVQDCTGNNHFHGWRGCFVFYPGVPYQEKISSQIAVALPGRKKKPEGSTLPAFLTMANWILPRGVQTPADKREL